MAAHPSPIPAHDPRLLDLELWPDNDPGDLVAPRRRRHDLRTERRRLHQCPNCGAALTSAAKSCARCRTVRRQREWAKHRHDHKER